MMTHNSLILRLDPPLNEIHTHLPDPRFPRPRLRLVLLCRLRTNVRLKFPPASPSSPLRCSTRGRSAGIERGRERARCKVENTIECCVIFLKPKSILGEFIGLIFSLPLRTRGRNGNGKGRIIPQRGRPRRASARIYDKALQFPF